MPAERTERNEKSTASNFLCTKKPPFCLLQHEQITTQKLKDVILLLWLLSFLRKLVQLPLLILSKSSVQLIETGGVLTAGFDEELAQVSLSLIIFLTHEIRRAITERHEVRFGASKTEIEGTGNVFPVIIFSFLVCEFGGGCCSRVGCAV